MNAIGFVTWSKLVPLAAEEQLMAAALEERGIEVVAVPWDTMPTLPTGLKALVIRTPWNYMLAPHEFMQWLERAAKAGVPVWNPVELIQWNIDKRYLSTLARQGIAVVPTVYVDRGSGRKLAKVAGEISGSRLIVKPTISAGAHSTFAIDRAQIAEFETQFAELLVTDTLMVQPMLEEVARDGEWSLIFFDGKFSHAVLKKPASGDFRVQEKHGGSVEVRDAPPELVAQATRVTEAIPYEWLYARVDGVVSEGKFLLMELEAFEPQLFVLDRPELATRFANAVMKRLVSA